MLGLSKAKWEEKEEGQEQDQEQQEIHELKQCTLSDFLS